MRALALTLLLACGPAAACGYCVEDKIAAVYDHAVVVQAFAHQHHVVFLHVDGTVPRALLQKTMQGTPGVDRGTARVSADALTVSFAYDPARASLGALHQRMEKALRGASLMPFEVIERPGQLKGMPAK